MTPCSSGSGAGAPPAQAVSGAAEDRLTLGGVLRAFLPDVLPTLPLSPRKGRVLWNLGACGQPELLGHCVYQCPECQHQHWTPRSCGDRHCPRCLSGKSTAWLDQQMESRLPVSYYHCVFTLPQELNALVLAHQKELYPLLFDCAAQTLLEFGRQRLGGDLGITAVLHTWGQKLDFHPHLHCIVTGGALRPDGKGWNSPRQRQFLFPIKALAALFRGKFLAGVRRLLSGGELPYAEPALAEHATRERWFSALYRKPWVVYAKRPFGGPEQVLRYLSNYTHRVAISNRRIVALDEANRTVSFRYRDYRDNSQQKVMTLTAREFIRRFSLHILPAKLVRIRHYGLLGNNRRKRDIALARAALSQSAPPVETNLPVIVPPPAAPTLLCPFCAVPLRLIALRDRDGVLHRLDRTPTAKYDSS